MAHTLFFVFAVVASAAARPTNISYELAQRNGLIHQNSPYILDDMLFVDGEQEERNFISYENMRWPNGIIPYVIVPQLLRYSFLVREAMKEYHTKTCIRFVRRTNQKNYIKIMRGHGCFSFVGMLGGGLQAVSLGDGCLFKGTIIHELGHAIGFFHEHNRYDRDEYLKIEWDNIQDGMQRQFRKNEPNEENTFHTSFDYNSIMLYGEWAFSKNHVNKTMIPTKSNATLKELHQKTALSATDAYKVNIAYKCK